MVLLSGFTSEIQWIGPCDPNIQIPRQGFKDVYSYNKCIIGASTYSVGDFVLVSNADSSEPDTVGGCDIAKIINLFEIFDERTDKDPCRAIVQWYSRPETIPHKFFDSDEICIDFDREVIEEHRPYDSDISLETIFGKCKVIFGNVEDSANGLHENLKHKTSLPIFVCRYKFLKTNATYSLVPLQASPPKKLRRMSRYRSSVDSTNSFQISIETEKRTPAKKEAANSAKKKYTPMPLSEKKKLESKMKKESLKYQNSSEKENKTKVTPIKIIGRKSVIKTPSNSVTKKYEVNANYLTNSPIWNDDKNNTVTPRNKIISARRNLNISLELDNFDDSASAQEDYLNYSIINDACKEDGMKLKLRLSEAYTKRNSTRMPSVESPRIQLDRKRLGDIKSDIYATPKKLKNSPESNLHKRRKSILKSASDRTAEGTPKRNIQLSNIVEKRTFHQNDAILMTPKRIRQEHNSDNDETYTPKSFKRQSRQLPKQTKKHEESDSDELYTPRQSSRKATCHTPKTKTPNSVTKINLSTNKKHSDETKSMTPNQKLKLIRSGDITPTIESRSTAKSSTNKSNLHLARERLHVSVIPESLPCREAEFENIYTFLQGKIQDQCGGCMYVSGVPGTGKTATVTAVIRSLKRNCSMENLSDFEFIEINGMRLTEPRQAYVQIYKQLTGKTVSWSHAHALLEKRFSTPAPRRATTVLLVDELDILCNRRQDVVYNLLDWPTKSAARLIVVTIANTMDLPERLLMGKVTSRLGLTRLTFKPYTYKQLQEIVTARLCGSEAIKGEAVQLAARKVAAVSGDARRALDICRRATEIADSADTDNKVVSMVHVQQALSEMIASAKVKAIKNCSELEQIFLQAIAAEVSRTGVEETTFMNVYSQFESITAFLNVSTPNPGRAMRICSKLGSERLIICEHSRNDIFQKILLNISMDDIHFALKI